MSTLRRLAGFAAIVLVFASSGLAFDLQSTTTSGRAPGAGGVGTPLTNGEIAINRADKRLIFKNIDGTLGYGSLLDAAPCGRAAVEQSDATCLGATPPSFGATSATLGALLDAAQPRVATNAALKLVSLPYSRIRRDGFAVPGDGGAADYTWSAAKCSAADDGAQVQPAGRMGCWIADLPSPASVRIWGADPTGSTGSAAHLNAAFAAAAASKKLLALDGRFLVDAPLTSRTDLVGTGGNIDQYATRCPAGVSTLVAGGDFDVLRARQGSVRNICFEMATAPGIRSAGSAIVVGGGGGNSGHQAIEHNGIVFPYDGITVGDGVGVVSMPYVNDNHVNIPARSGISVGRNTAYGATNELRASNNTVVCQQGNPPTFTGSISGTSLTASSVTGGTLAVGMQVVDTAGGVAANTIITAGSGSTWRVSVPQTVGMRTMAGSAPVAPTATGLAIYDAGLVISTDNELYGCGQGTTVTPGANQLVLYWGKGVQSDSALFNGLLFDATAPSATIVKAMLDGFWVGAGVGTDTAVTVRNSGGGFVQKLAFGTGQVNGAINSTNPLFDLSGAVGGISIVGTTIAPDSNGTSSTGIRDSTTGSLLVTGVNTSAAGGILGSGIQLQGNAGGKTITGNDLSNSHNPIVWLAPPTSTALHVVIANNTGVDDVQPSIASAATIAAPINPSFYLGGSAMVSVMNGFWSGRTLTIVPTDASSFVTGGTGNGKFCNAKTSAALVPITARYMAPFNCWRLD